MFDLSYKKITIYVREVSLAVRSIVGSCFTVLPYLLRIGDLKKEVTEGYPDPVSSKTADDLPPRSRGLLFNDIDRCTGCQKCAKACPSRCIYIELEKRSQAKAWVSVFDIDLSQCIFCGLCTEVCPSMSLIHTRQYEGAAYRLEDLVASFGRGKVTEEQRNKWESLRRLNEEKEDSSP